MKKGIFAGAVAVLIAVMFSVGTAQGVWTDWFKKTPKLIKTQAARPASTPDLTGMEPPKIPYTPYDFGPTLKHGDSPIWEEAISTFTNSAFVLNTNDKHDAFEHLALIGYYDLNYPDRIMINILLFSTFANTPHEFDVAFDAWIEFMKVDDGTFTRSLKSYVCSRVPTTTDVLIGNNNQLVTHLNWEDGQERCRKISDTPVLTDTSKYTAYLAGTAYEESKNSPNPQFNVSEFTAMVDFKVSFQFTQSGLQLVDLIMPYISPINLISDPNIFSPAMYYELFGKIRGTLTYNFIPDPVADFFIKPILKDGSNNPYNADFCYTNACTADHWHWTSTQTLPLTP
jgi:hypothetical protein